MLNFSKKEIDIIKKYQLLYNSSTKETNSELIFMNDGFCPIDNYGYPKHIDFLLPKKYQQWKYQVLLYKTLLDTAEINTCTTGNLLEVSCGMGGGLTFISECYNFNKLYGLDITPEHIDFCKKNISGVEFINSSAHKIPLPSNSLDFIISVEAFTYYMPLSNFIKECSRVLKNKGLLCIAATYNNNNDILNRNTYCNSRGFNVIKSLDISKNCHISASVSKWLVPNEIVRTVIKNDEKVHYEKKSIYEITICQNNKV